MYSTKILWAMIVCTHLIHESRFTYNETASWFDHPRDLLHLVNVKRAEMPRPIVGVGHSMGGAHLSVPFSIRSTSFRRLMFTLHPASSSA